MMGWTMRLFFFGMVLLALAGFAFGTSNTVNSISNSLIAGSEGFNSLGASATTIPTTTIPPTPIPYLLPLAIRNNPTSPDTYQAKLEALWIRLEAYFNNR